MRKFLDYLFRRFVLDKDFLLGPVLAIAVIASSFVALSEKQTAPNNERELILAIGIILVAMAVVMIRYLGGSAKTFFSDSKERIAIFELSKRVKELQLQRDALTKENRSELLNGLSERLKQEASENLLNELKKQVKENEYRLRLSESSKITLHRIYAEIDALGRRGAINLVLGVITALVGVGALSFFVLNDARSHESLTEFAIAFIPRLSIVVIIEIFAYFFLRLYKTSLAEIKYFQNEATNIEFNFIALETALHLSKQDLIQKALNKFIEIERNPIMKKGQTTRELEQDALFEKNIKMTPEHLTEIIRALSPRSVEKSGNKSEQ